MKVRLCHFREMSKEGGYIDIAVFDFNPSNNQKDAALAQLTLKARAAGLKIDKAALAFRKNNGNQFYGPDDVINFLSRSGVPRWNKEITF